VTIEIACDTTHPYKITEGTMCGLIDLSADICKRNNIPKLLWKADKSLIGKIDKQNITVHRWFSATACPGDYIFSQLGYVADEVNKILTKKPDIVLPPTNPPPTTGDYTVRINTASLNYRKGPSTNYPIVGIVRKDQVYTIVQESFGLGASKWGKLKSGAGWISLDYCVKVR
jgi:uncharacterized protein YgiM (DUF1202 family)